ncbi:MULTISPECIES: hypothetical protein [Actinokineospora]|uniref:Uncharacterized protein n=2 Tax=Actinokineospora TaxID=39845 RepID=A0A421AXS3_9PSEU|nr:MULTISPECIES: hypothetical protein [Actinokineospora]RLK54589.1 hypothetical protein CLV68_5622 [Actinokineospora cianjurensis]SES44494.1 hypothetical protein SAMN04487818_114167 [Actinokineospora terrae]
MRHAPIVVDTFVTINADCVMRAETGSDGVEVHFNESITGQDFTMRFTRDALETLISVCSTELAA